MENQKQTENYFNLFYDWSTKDVKKCLDLKNNAGPILSMVVNGIDILGGMYYGFSTGSKTRSTIFMEKKMDIPKSLAEFIYKSIRCGMVHEGMPKTAELSFGFNGKRIFSKHSTGRYLYLNVEFFAEKYLEAISEIKNNIDNIRLHSPATGNSSELFNNAMKDAQNEWIDDTVFQDSESSSSSDRSQGSSINS